MKSNPRPRKYASDAERQAAFRARNVLVEFRAEPKTADKLTEIAAAIDVSRSDLLLSMVKFALTNHDWARFGLTHKTIPLYQGNPIMATKKASPAQIAARKRFAEMARSGELQKMRMSKADEQHLFGSIVTRKKAIKKNPAAEREMSSTSKERPNYRVVVTNRNSPDYFYLSESGAVNEAKQLSRLGSVGEIYKNMTKRGAFKWECVYWFDSTGVYPAGSEGQANTRINPSARKKTVSQKISQLTHEGYPQKQAVAVALSEERAGKVKRNPEPSHDFARIGKPFSYDGRTWKVSGYSHNGKTIEAYTTDRKKYERRVFSVAELMAGRGIAGLVSLSKNPAAKKLYTVHRADAKGAPVYHIAHFNKQADAKQYAQAYADLHKTPVAITSKAM